MTGPCVIFFIPGTLGIVIATQYGLGISESIYHEVLQRCQFYRRSLPIQSLGTLTNDGPYYNSRFLGLNRSSFTWNTNPILKILLSLKLITCCDRGVRGFPEVSLRLLYGPSGCGIGLLVVVGTSRPPGVGGLESNGLTRKRDSEAISVKNHENIDT